MIFLFNRNVDAEEFFYVFVNFNMELLEKGRNW